MMFLSGAFQTVLLVACLLWLGSISIAMGFMKSETALTFWPGLYLKYGAMGVAVSLFILFIL